MFDMSKLHTLVSGVPQCIQEVQRYCTESTKIILLGSKADLAGEDKSTCEQIRQEVIKLKRDYKTLIIGYFETSAKTGLNVEKTVNFAINMDNEAISAV